MQQENTICSLVECPYLQNKTTSLDIWNHESFVLWLAMTLETWAWGAGWLSGAFKVFVKETSHSTAAFICVWKWFVFPWFPQPHWSCFWSHVNVIQNNLQRNLSAVLSRRMERMDRKSCTQAYNSEAHKVLCSKPLAQNSLAMSRTCWDDENKMQDDNSKTTLELRGSKSFVSQELSLPSDVWEQQLTKDMMFFGRNKKQEHRAKQKRQITATTCVRKWTTCTHDVLFCHCVRLWHHFWGEDRQKEERRRFVFPWGHPEPHLAFFVPKLAVSTCLCHWQWQSASERMHVALNCQMPLCLLAH